MHNREIHEALKCITPPLMSQCLEGHGRTLQNNDENCGGSPPCDVHPRQPGRETAPGVRPGDQARPEIRTKDHRGKIGPEREQKTGHTAQEALVPTPSCQQAGMP